MNKFQQRFIQAKELSGMKWVDIAKKSGLEKASISQYKNGVHIPEQDALYRLSKALGVNVEWLMGHDAPMETVDISRLFSRLKAEDQGKVIAIINDMLKSYR